MTCKRGSEPELAILNLFLPFDNLLLATFLSAVDIRGRILIYCLAVMPLNLLLNAGLEARVKPYNASCLDLLCLFDNINLHKLYNNVCVRRDFGVKRRLDDIVLIVCEIVKLEILLDGARNK